MSEQIKNRIIAHLKSDQYRPAEPGTLAKDLAMAGQGPYHAFRDALKELMHAGRVVLGLRGAVVLPSQKQGHNEIIGSYRHNRRGFGFVVPMEPDAHEDLFVPPGENAGAINGDVVRARITSRGERDGRSLYTGRVMEIIERKHTRFAGSLLREKGQWFVAPDGRTMTEPILVPDAGSRHLRPCTKVIVEVTRFAEPEGILAQGVIVEVLGEAGEKDVDLKSVIVEYNLPGEFSTTVTEQARQAVSSYDPKQVRRERLDLSGEVVVTIDPDDAKDYDDAISLRRLESGLIELGVHIADVSYFVPEGTPLDVEARERGNSTYFPGFVIPMLPEILSNGVCSLQEGVPRLTKSAFITLDDDARPVRTRFANTIITSACRLRYREAQAIIDRADVVPHPDGPRRVSDYDPKVVELIDQMNELARRIQKRRRAQGQLVLDLPQVELVLDDQGRVTDAVPEDSSFTHTLIEMFMVEANEAVARLLDSVGVPFLRRVHPEPDLQDADRLRQFVQVAGHKIPKQIDRHSLQHLLESLRGRPEAFAINLAVLKSLTRAEYSPEPVGHYALASEQYCHFTSPIRRYADLTIHRLLDRYIEVTGSADGSGRSRGGRKGKVALEGTPSTQDLIQAGRHISFTERRSEDAERELRMVKVLALLEKHVGDEFLGVVTGITNFGVFIQLEKYLVDGLIRFERLMDDWWEVNEKTGIARGQRTGRKIGIGDVCRVAIASVDQARRELNLTVQEILGRGAKAPRSAGAPKDKPVKHAHIGGGQTRRNQRAKGRDRGKQRGRR
jgi:ribonuclease R